VAKHSIPDLQRLIVDLNRLRDQYPELPELSRLIGGMGWGSRQREASHDSPITCLEVIEHLVQVRRTSTSA